MMGTSTGTGNYHTHTRHCDGHGDPRDFAAAAMRKGMPRLGFSGHNVVPFPTDWTMPEENLAPYLSEVRAAREEYRGRVEILLGIEADYIPGLTTPTAPRIRDLGLDFVIGSVHFVGPRDGDHRFTVDGPRAELDSLLREDFGGDARRMVERYYALLSEMALTATPDIIGHFDLVKKNNRGGDIFDEGSAWYRDAVGGALDAVKKSGAVMEINTGGMLRNTSGAFYPSAWIVREAATRGIPVMINADAHRPEHIDGLFMEAAAFLRDAGYRSQRQLAAGGWFDVAL